jgi:hypothetical protein
MVLMELFRETRAIAVLLSPVEMNGGAVLHSAKHMPENRHIYQKRMALFLAIENPFMVISHTSEK